MVYETPDQALRTLALLKKGAVFQQEGQYAEAQRTLERANAFVGADSLRYQVMYQSALNAYLAGMYPQARTHAQKVRFLLANTPFQWEAFHLELMSLHEERKWSEARELYAQHYLAAGWNANAEAMYGEPVKLKNEDRAEWLQIFLPGVGQMYAGKFGEGLVSGLANGGAIAYAVYHAWQGYWFTAAFTGAGLFYAFYTGGLRYTTTLVQNYNQRAVEEYNRNLQERLLGEVEQVRASVE